MFSIGEISGRGVYRGVDLEANFFNFACTQSAGNQLVHPRSLLIAFAVCISYRCKCVCTFARCIVSLSVKTYGRGVSDKSAFCFYIFFSCSTDREKHGILPILTLRNSVVLFNNYVYYVEEVFTTNPPPLPPENVKNYF